VELWQGALAGLVNSMDANFWRGRRIFLTGHTGFKGGWLSIWLHKLGAEVTGYALPPPTDPSLFDLAGVQELTRSVNANVTDLHEIKRVIADFSPEIVIHMAAQPLVHAGYNDPVQTYQTNVMGTVNVLEAVRQSRGVRAVLNVTTDKCYENREWEWGYRENDRLGGFDPYSNSKACSELVTQSYRNAFFPTELYEKHGVAVATARAGNVIGGGDWGTDRLVPDIVRAIVSQQPVKIRCPDSIRPWQYVLEPLSGYLTLIERLVQEGPRFAMSWNFGPQDESAQPVKWLVEQLTRQWGGSAAWEMDSISYHHEARYLKLDCSRARSELGWCPKLTLQQAMQWTVDWYRAWNSGQDMREVCLRQISLYEEGGAA
jgi:CDP-glucose 4,6-dehydratase